jgi:hypothetical protein
VRQVDEDPIFENAGPTSFGDTAFYLWTNAGQVKGIDPYDGDVYISRWTSNQFRRLNGETGEARWIATSSSYGNISPLVWANGRVIGAVQSNDLSGTNVILDAEDGSEIAIVPPPSEISGTRGIVWMDPTTDRAGFIGCTRNRNTGSTRSANVWEGTDASSLLWQVHLGGTAATACRGMSAASHGIYAAHREPSSAVSLLMIINQGGGLRSTMDVSDLGDWTATESAATTREKRVAAGGFDHFGAVAISAPEMAGTTFLGDNLRVYDAATLTVLFEIDRSYFATLLATTSAPQILDMCVDKFGEIYMTLSRNGSSATLLLVKFSRLGDLLWSFVANTTGQAPGGLGIVKVDDESGVVYAGGSTALVALSQSHG